MIHMRYISPHPMLDEQKKLIFFETNHVRKFVCILTTADFETTKNIDFTEKKKVWFCSHTLNLNQFLILNVFNH